MLSWNNAVIFFNTGDYMSTTPNLFDNLCLYTRFILLSRKLSYKL